MTMRLESLHKIWTRDFSLASLALFGVGFVFHVLVPTIPVFLSTLKSTEIEIGILVAASGFSSLIFRPVVGGILQTVAEKRVMLAGALLYMMSSVAYLYARPFWPLLMVRILQGIGFAFFHTASFVFIARICPDAYRAQGLSYFILSFNVASAMAPPVGMFLVNRFSFNLLFQACAVLSLCSLVISWRLGPHAAAMKGAAAQHGYLSREAVFPSVVGGFCLLIWGGLTAFFPLYAIGQGVSNPGLFFTVFATMLILGRSLGGKILSSVRREKIILFSLAAYVVAMAILAFSKTLPMFILVAVIGGAGHAFLIPTLIVYALEAGSAPGPGMGTFHALTDLGLGLGPVVTGVILRLTSYRAMFFSLMLASIINLAYFSIFCRKRKAVSSRKVPA